MSSSSEPLDAMIRRFSPKLEAYGYYHDGKFHEDFHLTRPGMSGPCGIAWTAPISQPLSEEDKVFMKLRSQPIIIPQEAKRLVFPVKTKEDVDGIYQLIGTIIDRFPSEKFDIDKKYNKYYGLLSEYNEQYEQLMIERRSRILAASERIEKILKEEFDGKISVDCTDCEHRSNYNEPIADLLFSNEETPKEWYGNYCSGSIDLLFVVSHDKFSFSWLVNTIPC